jgi:hypothetical protein
MDSQARGGHGLAAVAQQRGVVALQCQARRVPPERVRQQGVRIIKALISQGCANT